MPQPHAFTDTTGRRWPVVVTLATIRAVKDRHAIDLSRFAIDGDVLKAFECPFRFSEILSTILAKDLAENNLSPSDLEAAMSGDAIDAAVFAVVRAIRDFLPEAPRKIAAKVVEAMEDADRKRTAMATKAVESGALDAAYNAAMDAADRELDAALQSTR